MELTRHLKLKGQDGEITSRVHCGPFEELDDMYFIVSKTATDIRLDRVIIFFAILLLCEFHNILPKPRV